jgi:GTP-binding protein EngB required for normal cell division
MTRSYGDEPPAERGSVGRDGPAQTLRWTADLRAAIRGTRQLLAEHGRNELQRVLDDCLRSQQEPPQVVFVGEAKRGKSSLVNALLERPNLSPTGADITTTRSLRFVPSEAEGEQAVLRFADDSVRAVDAAELEIWATATAPLGAEEPRLEDIDVHVSGGCFAPAVLVDTPGVGGLDSGHSELALLAARRAGILVFVTDAGQPLTRSECAFLARAAETVDSVVLAVTKVDKYAAGRDQVIAEDAALLRRYAPRFGDAPIVATSSEWARRAQKSSDELAPLLRNRSGVPELTAVILDRLARMDDLRARNSLRAASFVLNRLLDDLRAHLAAARQEPGIADRARAERDQLRDLRDQETRWSLNLERDLRRLRARSTEFLTSEVERLRKQWRGRIERERAGFRKTVAEELTTALQADLAVLLDAVARQLKEGMDEVITAMLSRECVSLLAEPTEIGSSHRAMAPAPAGPSNLFDPTIIGTGSVGASLGAQLAGGLLWGVPLIAGAAFIGLTTLHKQVQLARRRQLEWAYEEIGRARLHAGAYVDQIINEARPEIVVTFRGQLTARAQELQAVVREADAALKSGESARRQRTSVLQAHITSAEARLAEVDALLVAADPVPEGRDQ